MELFCAEHGDPTGTPVLLGGSLGTTHEMWAPQLPALVPDRRLIAFDLRGHGRSPAPPGPYAIADLGGDVLALMDRLEIARADYVGLSIGGMVGQWLAVHAPDRIGRLALLATAPDTANPDAFRERAAAVRAAGSTAGIAAAVVANWFTPAWAATHPDVVAGFERTLAAQPFEGYAGCCDAVAGHDVADRLAEVTCPTLVVAGAEDRAIPVAQSRRIAAGIPGARLEVLSPAAHLLGVERADRVSGLLVDWLSPASFRRRPSIMSP